MGDGGGEAVEAKGKEGVLHAELSLGELPTENPPLLVGEAGRVEDKAWGGGESEGGGKGEHPIKRSQTPRGTEASLDTGLTALLSLNL